MGENNTGTPDVQDLINILMGIYDGSYNGISQAHFNAQVFAEHGFKRNAGIIFCEDSEWDIALRTELGKYGVVLPSISEKANE